MMVVFSRITTRESRTPIMACFYMYTCNLHESHWLLRLHATLKMRNLERRRAQQTQQWSDINFIEVGVLNLLKLL